MRVGSTSLTSGCQIEANRLFGPQPHTATYACMWEIWLGEIHGDLSVPGVKGLSAVARSFTYNFVDEDNAMPPEFSVPLDPDMTFVAVAARSMELRVRAFDQAIIYVKLEDNLLVEFDDIPFEHYLDHLSLTLPGISASLLIQEQRPGYEWVELASKGCGPW